MNTASRMETSGLENRIHVSGPMKEKLGQGYTFEARGRIEIKGKEPMETWFLTGKE